MLTRDDSYQLNSEQLLIAEFDKNVIEYYDELVWLLHSQNPDRMEYADREKFRMRISDKFARIVADYNTLVNMNLVNSVDKTKMDARIKEYEEIDKLLYESFRSLREM